MRRLYICLFGEFQYITLVGIPDLPRCRTVAIINIDSARKLCKDNTTRDFITS